MSALIDLYQEYCPYKITNCVQEIDFSFDIQRLRQEIFRFIVDNKYGTSVVSLRLPKGQSDYININEKLETGAIDATNIYNDHNMPDNETNNREYTEWHPDLQNSYVASLVPLIEKTCGLNIGRIRLGWLLPGQGYPMHCDLEPMRLHIPLFTNNLAYMIHDHEIHNMKYGKLYHLITTEIHTAWNFGKLPRLHLIFSTYKDSNLDKEIEKIAQNSVTNQNFADAVFQQGVDKYSLSMLLRIEESTKDLDPDAKKSEIRKIKRIIDILANS